MRHALSYLKLLKNTLQDAMRYARSASHPSRRLNAHQIEARLLQKSHSVEKGLAMPSPRFGFGKAPLSELRSLVQQADQAGIRSDSTGRLMAAASMGAYAAHHDLAGQALPDDLQFVRQLAAPGSGQGTGATLEIRAQAFRLAAQGNFDSLAHARHSFRMFAPGEVDEALVKTAVAIATRSPSVCNRQAARAYLLKRSARLQQVLAIQGGNRGFAEEIPAVLVVTCDLSAFRGSRERYQAWIGGGLFSMSLMYALTARGLGTCPLNWSADHAQDARLRQVLPIPDHETVIMLIAVGNVRERSVVAASPRKSVDEIYKVL